MEVNIVFFLLSNPLKKKSSVINEISWLWTNGIDLEKHMTI